MPARLAQFASASLVATCALLVSAGCTTSTELGGVWRSDALVGGPLVGDGVGPGVAVEFVLGHYGLDVAGVVRFYDDDVFESPSDPTAPYRACACAFIHKGRWRVSSDAFDFQLRGCLPGASPSSTLLVRGELKLVGDTLDGILRVEDPESPLLGTTQPLVLRRTSGLGDADLGCEVFTDASAGNRASGR